MVRDLLSWLVSGKNTQNKREHLMNLRIVSRRLARSQKKLESKTKITERKVRDAIQRGDMQAARLYANDIVRSRKWALGYQSLNSKIEGLIFKLERTDAVTSLSKEMKNVATSLKAVSTAIDIEEVDEVAREMEKAMEEIDLSSEVMEDSVEGMFATDTDEKEVDSILAEYGAEAGVTASSGLPTPVSTTTVRGNISDLEKEIEELRKKE